MNSIDILTFILFCVCMFGIGMMGVTVYRLRTGLFVSCVSWLGFVAFGAWATSGVFQWGLLGLAALALLLIFLGMWVGIRDVVSD